jgi:predicted component of type VI protein secretion system
MASRAKYLRHVLTHSETCIQEGKQQNRTLTVKNKLADGGREDNVSLTFQSMKDFSPVQIFRQITY